MGKEADNHEEHGHAGDAHHAHTQNHPFTEHEQVLINMAHQQAVFDAHHHHHHHHDHVEYRRPFELTTSLGLFALKKLNAMNPDILQESEKKLLNASAPGVISSLGHGAILFGATVYAGFVWKNLGLAGFARPVALIPLGGFAGAFVVFNWTANYLRELTLSGPRRKLISTYKDRYGASFLLDVLEPRFRLPESMSGQQ